MDRPCLLLAGMISWGPAKEGEGMKTARATALLTWVAVSCMGVPCPSVAATDYYVAYGSGLLPASFDRASAWR